MILRSLYTLGRRILSIDLQIGKKSAAAEDFYQYQYIRENIAGDIQELWYHEQGDQSWLVVTRNTLTHEIKNVELAQDFSRSKGREK